MSDPEISRTTCAGSAAVRSSNRLLLVVAGLFFACPSQVWAAPPQIPLLSHPIDQTLIRADAVVRVGFTEPYKPGDGPELIVFDAVVERVLFGEGLQVGAEIALEQQPWADNLRWAPHSCINQTSLLHGARLRGTSWLIAVKRLGDLKEESNRYTIPWPDGLLGTRLDKELVGAGAVGREAILAELLASLDSKDPVVRRSVMKALRGWEGLRFPPQHSALWEDPAVARRLLALADDPDDSVRWQLGFMIPANAGEAGEQQLFRFLFDPTPLVRQPARMQLVSRGFDEMIAAAEVAEDLLFEEWTAPTVQETYGWHRTLTGWEIEQLLAQCGDEDARSRAEAAWRLGFQRANPKALEALSRALSDDSWEVRRWAAAAIGRLEAVELKAALLAHDESQAAKPDPRVRVQIGGALLRIGQVRPGLDELRKVCAQAPARAVVQALSELARHGGVQALAVVAEAVRDQRPVVRAFAGANLHRFAQHAEHQVAALRGDLRDDEHPLVRAAGQ